MAASFPNLDPLYYGDHAKSGVDRSLLREMLKLTPLERLTKIHRHAQDTLKLLEYGRKHRKAAATRDRGPSS
jgi:hypothetical protein